MPSSNVCSKSKALVEINGIHNRKKTRNATKPARRGLLEHVVIIIDDSDSESTLKENQPSTSSVDPKASESSGEADHSHCGLKRKESSAKTDRSQGGLKRKHSSAKADHSQGDLKRKDLIAKADQSQGCSKRKVASDSGADASKRQKSSVRVVGGRIYDSENGSTCHQELLVAPGKCKELAKACRQKTVDVMATCKSGENLKRLCKQKFCSKCLLNRYGEKVEDVIRLDVWPCPRCRGICNCSICMKKKGCSPTGILSHTARATGFASVAEYLKESKTEDSSIQITKSSLDGKTNGNSKQCAESYLPEGELVNKQKKKKKSQGKENGVESALNSKDSKAGCQEKVHLKKQKEKKSRGKQNGVESVLNSKDSEAGCQEKVHLKKQKRKKSQGKQNGVESVLNSKVSEGGCQEINEEVHLKKQKGKKSQGKQNGVESVLNSKDSEAGCEEINEKVHLKKQKGKKSQGKQNAVESVLNSKDSEAGCEEIKEKVHLKKQKGRHLVANGDKSESQRSEKRALVEVRSAQLDGRTESLQNVEVFKPNTRDRSDDVILPVGEELTNVAGLDLSQNSIGPALQLLEFCSAFMKLLDFKKGQAEAILREIVRGTMVRRSAQSLFVQLHVKLLSYILEDDGEPCHVTASPSGENSWMVSLRKHLLEKSYAFNKISVSSIDAMQSGIAESSNASPKTSLSALSQEKQALFLQALESGADGYASLELHRKLELVNILCDDCLSTSKFRDYLENALANHEERQKATKEEILAARKEVKAASQKKKDAEAERLLALEKGAPLSADKQTALLQKVRLEAQKVAAARMALSEVASKTKTQKCDAIRTEPVAVNDGRVFWRLKGAEDRSVIVIQDVGNLDFGVARETWSSYSEDQEELLVKYVSRKRLRELRSQPRCVPSLEKTAGSPERPACSDISNSQS